MLNLVNASQGYVGDIVNAYGSDKKLKEITNNLERFTTNLQGQTYDIEIVSEEKTRQLYASLEPDTIHQMTNRTEFQSLLSA